VRRLPKASRGRRDPRHNAARSPSRTARAKRSSFSRTARPQLAGREIPSHRSLCTAEERGRRVRPPVVPRHEDHGRVPELALADCVDDRCHPRLYGCGNLGFCSFGANRKSVEYGIPGQRKASPLATAIAISTRLRTPSLLRI
jgi:hypothetical protein